jgi:hypothetical protein
MKHFSIDAIFEIMSLEDGAHNNKGIASRKYCVRALKYLKMVNCKMHNLCISSI